jgi:hypothetical protein
VKERAKEKRRLSNPCITLRSMPFWACWLLNSAKPDGLVVASVIRTTFGCQAVRPVKTQNFRFAFHKGLAGITATPRRPSLCASAKQTTCPMTWPQNDPNVSLRVQQKNYNRKALHNPQRPAVLILPARGQQVERVDVSKSSSAAMKPQK